MPFVTVALDFSRIETTPALKAAFDWLAFTDPVDFVLAFGTLLFAFYLIRAALNLVYFHLLARFSDTRYYLLAYRLFESYLGMPYRKFTGRNSGHLTKNLVNEAANLTRLISSLLLMFSEIVVFAMLYGLLLWVNLKITLLATIVMGIKVALLYKTVTRSIRKAGNRRAAFQRGFYETVTATFGNFKFIKLLGNQREVLEKFRQASYGYARANMTSASLGHFPRIVMETMTFLLTIAALSYLAYRYPGGVAGALPVIALYIAALYRLLPSLNRIFAALNEISFQIRSLEIVHNELMYDDIEPVGGESITFQKEIRLENLSFGFEKPLFENLSLTIPRGGWVALTGESGSGKSTLADLIMGLYKPQSGTIRIDGVALNDENVASWRRQIGYIPQQVYLFDGTVGENVMFGRAHDRQKAIKALKAANIWNFLESKEGLETPVGEGGLQLSGGQKQRIAIARALFSEPDLLVLDEATSALDQETEAEIMNEVYSLAKGKTLILITHRPSTASRCTLHHQVSVAHAKNTR